MRRHRFAGAKFVTKDTPAVAGGVQKRGLFGGGMGPLKKMTEQAKAKMKRTKLGNAAEKMMFAQRSR